MALLTGWFDKNTDANDDPLSGALVYVYLPGTTTPVSVFSDEEMTVPAANPIVCDSAGVLPIRYVAVGTYKIRVTTSAGAEVRTTDDFEVGGAGGTVTLTNYGKPRSLALLEAFDSSVTAVQTTGYATSGDGGAALYKRVGSEPNHSGKFQDGNDDWWEYADIEGGVNVRALSTDDDAAFAAAKSIAENYTGWRSGYMVTPTVLDLGGRVWRLTSPVWIQAGVTLINGTIEFTDAALSGSTYGIRLGLTGTEGTSLKQLVRDVTFTVYDASGNLLITQNHEAALLDIPRTFGGRLENVSCNAGLGTYRTRYGVYLGRRKGWSISVEGGRFSGGECPLRIGRDSDHTGIVVRPDIIDHGRVCNLMLCNPKGAEVLGRIEHSDALASIVITSGTSGLSSNVAENITIKDGYMFNDSSDTYRPDAVQILAGHDVLGTMGWDVDDELVTSPSSVSHLRIVNCYAVAPNCATTIKAKIFRGLVIEDLKWEARGKLNNSAKSGTFTPGETITGGTSGVTASLLTDFGHLYISSATGDFTDGETITGGTSGSTITYDAAGSAIPVMLELSGVAANCYIREVANQRTGALTPVIRSTATNPVNVSLQSQDFTPVIKGMDTPGTVTYTARSGGYVVTDSILHISAYANFSAVSGAVGDAVFSLPSLVSRATVRTSAAVHAAGFSGPIQGQWLAADYVRLFLVNTVTGAAVPSSGQISVNLSIPLRFEL